jgi:hypothetical protein
VSAGVRVTPEVLEDRLDSAARLVRAVAEVLAGADGPVVDVDLLAGALDTVAALAAGQAADLRAARR